MIAQRAEQFEVGMWNAEVGKNESDECQSNYFLQYFFYRSCDNE